MTKQTKAKPEWGTQTSHLLVHQWNIIMEHNATSVRRIPAFVTRQQTVAATRLSLKKIALGNPHLCDFLSSTTQLSHKPTPQPEIPHRSRRVA